MTAPMFSPFACEEPDCDGDADDCQDEASAAAEARWREEMRSVGRAPIVGDSRAWCE